MMFSLKLLQKYPIISDQVDEDELLIILKELEQQLMTSQDGSVVELGCYMGTTSLFIRRLLDRYDFVGEFHVYDSFEGLPEKAAQDASLVGEQFKLGELATSKKSLIKHFKRASLKLPVAHKAWFADLSTHDIPDNIRFAFLDGDYYYSIKNSLALIEPKLARDAVIIVDDYANEALPGAAKAVDEWRLLKEAKLQIASSLAIIKL